MISRSFPRRDISTFSVLFPIIFFSHLVLAQSSAIQTEEGESKLKISENLDSTLPLDQKGKKAFLGQVRVESMQYMTTLSEAPHLTSSQLLSARLSGADYFSASPRFGYGVDVSAGTYFSWHQSNFFLNELYLRRDLSSSSNLSLGRRKFAWSELDYRWQLGLWQPKFTLDALRPEDQGLTGLFYHRNEERSEVLVMGTLLFIPTMSPEIRKEGGQLVSDSRWYREPSQTWDLNGRSTTIYYDMSVPDMESLASKPGAAAMVRLGSRKSGARAILAAAYKPVNDLLLKRSISQVVGDTKVVVAPDVTYHSLVSMDLGYASGPINGWVSVMADEPQEKLLENEPRLAIQKLEKVQIYSANLDIDFTQVVTRPLILQASYLKTYGGGIVDVDSAGNKDPLTLFEDRFKFSNAAMLSLQGEPTQFFSKPLIGKFSYIYDFDQRGSIWGLEFQVFPAQKWAVVLGADLLGVENPTDTDKSFINQFRANDRYYGGMTYVF